MKEVRIVRVRYRFQFLLGHVSVQTTERYYVQKVDMCSGCPKSPVVNAHAWLDSA
jgi:hypothetical protein